MKHPLFLLVIIFCLGSCRQSDKVFELLPADRTGIDFTNNITESKEHNVFTYQYYYNGNGVAVGDLNNDGLSDVFFTGNQTPSKLYLNKGDFHFEDVTTVAGVSGRKDWRTGATMIDINADGLLDIYVCYSGFGTDEQRANELFINKGPDKNGVPVFHEEAMKWGVDAPGTYTSQAAFFDYDQDGDLDMFLLNHANEFYSPFFNTHRLRTLRHPRYGNRLYRNDSGHFIDISEAAAILGGGNNFGLGIAISDINNDSWPDILVSNDFHEQDYFYINDRKGGFKEVSKQVFAHMSRNTMGLDIADFNNDLLPDVVTLDMLPESNYRQKILQGADEYDKYNLMVDSGYGHQNNRNMLQVNQGFSSDSLPVFAEIGQLSGVSNTDWSWAALFADFDNDGWKDLFVTNGYLRESTNLDFMKYEVAEAVQQVSSKGLDISTAATYAANMPLYDLVQRMPSTRISNYMYRNRGDLSFNDETTNWGLEDPGVSSGAAYSDLDNDGDLDLIVCNNNDPVWIYRNNHSKVAENNFIRIKLKGDQQNSFAVGAKVIVSTDKGDQIQEMYPVRGYQSSVDYVLNFGLGDQHSIREVRVQWSADKESIISSPAINSVLVVSKQQAVEFRQELKQPACLFKDVTDHSGVQFKHQENLYVDFKREYLLPYELSRLGSRLAKADVNKDGLDDFYIGGAIGQSGCLYMQLPDGMFKVASSQPWKQDAESEDISALFFDADKDGDADLYVTSGGSEWVMPGPALQDRLYVNNGKGEFIKSEKALPNEVYNGTCVSSADFDKDGDIDLFVGAGAIPGYYPFNKGNMILRNDTDPVSKELKFTDVTNNIGGDSLSKAGMCTDASWTDVDNDGWLDLIVIGNWMPVTFYHNDKGNKFRNITESLGLQKTNGWWCRILPADIDNDGDQDFILGNMGTNTQFKTSEQEPLALYVDDFNNDERIDPIMTWYIQHKSYPFNSRDELVEQMPVLNKRFLKYADFGKATIETIINKDQLAKARKYYIYHTKTSLLINNKGKFELKELPVQTQFSIVNSILYNDFDGDGNKDILLAGNFFPFRVQQGRCDAGMGCLLKGNGKGGFEVVNPQTIGVFIKGDVRDIVPVKTKDGFKIIVSKNNDAVQVIEPLQAKL